MSIIQAVILGIVQGITEFLPISSSGHLVLLPYFLNWELDQNFIFTFDVLVQNGTLVAILIYYRKDLQDITNHMWAGIKNRNIFKTTQSRIGWFALIATIPTSLIGLLIKNHIKESFSNPNFVAVFLLITSALLLLAEKIGKRKKTLETMTIYDALWIGVFQVMALFPGISRSGSTISGGMTRNIKRKDSGLFSFLMAIPILAVAGVIGIIDLVRLQDLNSYLPALVIGGVTAAGVGFFTIKWLLNFLNSHSLFPFIIYCALFGTFSLLTINIGNFTNPIRYSMEKSQEASIQIVVDPELEWILPALNQCVKREGNYLIQTSTFTDETIGKTDLFFSLGENPSIEKSAFKIGDESLVLISHLASPLRSVDLDITKDIISGKITTWHQVAKRCDFCLIENEYGESDQIQLYTYPLGSRMGSAIQTIFGDTNISSFASLLPSSKTIQFETSENPNSVAFLPERWVGESVRVIEIIDGEIKQFTMPILIYGFIEENDKLKNLMYCVQSSIQ